MCFFKKFCSPLTSVLLSTWMIARKSVPHNSPKRKKKVTLAYVKSPLSATNNKKKIDRKRLKFWHSLTVGGRNKFAVYLLIHTEDNERLWLTFPNTTHWSVRMIKYFCKITQHSCCQYNGKYPKIHHMCTAMCPCHSKCTSLILLAECFQCVIHVHLQ